MPIKTRIRPFKASFVMFLGVLCTTLLIGSLVIQFSLFGGPNAKSPIMADSIYVTTAAHRLPGEWVQTYGGDHEDVGAGVIEYSGGGFVIVGYTWDDVAGVAAAWLIHTDQNGNHLWNQTFSGAVGEIGSALVECSGGGFAFAGYTTSYGVNGDGWLVRTDADGNYLWNQSYGGSSTDEFWDLVECTGGGFALSGYTFSYSVGEEDFWLVRTDADGNHLWNQSYGGSSDDYCVSMVECNDGGFALTGYTRSFGPGNRHAWLVRTDADGNYLWNTTFGLGSWDFGRSVIECSDGGFAITGKTESYGYSEELWLIRTDQNGNHLWNRTYQGNDLDSGYAVVEVSAGGFAIGGYTSSYGTLLTEMFLLRTDTDGNPLWNKTFGMDVAWDSAYDLIETNAGDFALVGRTYNDITDQIDVLFVLTEDEPPTTTTTTGQFIPGFPLVAITIGMVLALGVILFIKRRKKPE